MDKPQEKQDIPAQEEVPKKYSSKGVKTKLNNAAEKMFFNSKHS